jgi:hypothetical protein
MTYTVERLHSCIGEDKEAIFCLTYEVTYIPELNTWRHVLVHEQELRAKPLNAAIDNL